jgi:hypothetical protein
MWAAGSEGGIALSVDGGQHWQKKHQDIRGGVLLTLTFVNDKSGFAAGTGPQLLVTNDGGETWSNGVGVPETVFQAAFGDSLHGVIRTRSALLSTDNGGKTWKPASPANDPDWQQKYPYTASMAALDGMHMAVRVTEGKWSDGEFLWTADGGETWSANYLPNGAGGGRLFVVGSEFWSVGGEVVGKDKPGGGLNIPMAVRSRNGSEWDHLPAFYDACHWTGCGGCTAQGCFAGRRSFVPFSRILQGNVASDKAPSDSLVRFPEHLLSSQWARTGETLCLLTRGIIECAGLSPTTELNTQGDQAEWDDGFFPPLGPSKTPSLESSSIEPALKQGVRCIRCDLERQFISNKGKSGPVAFQLSFTIEPDGRVEKIAISGGLPDDVSSKVQNIALGWRFEPFMQNGQPKPVSIALRGQLMVMNPESH